MDSRIRYLFLRYLNDECTAGELEEVFSSLKDGTYTDEWKAAISEDATDVMKGEWQTELSMAEADQLYARIERGLRPTNGNHEPIVSTVRKIWAGWVKYGVAAAIAMVLSVGGYFYLNNTQGISGSFQPEQTDIMPGSNQASLTLADGAVLSLAGGKDGKLAEQAGVRISKTADGHLVYHSEAQVSITKIPYNTVATPKGGQYRIELPDGTGVWLNAASSLKFPVTFSGAKERRVELTGEAYFEVAKDKSHPFIVTGSRQEVKVLGTHFLINSYLDEPVTKTTLMEGSVQVSPMTSGLTPDLNHAVKLAPGQQSILRQQGLEVASVDLEEAMAWKNGYFRFNDEQLESIMRKLARWYDIDVSFQGYKNNDGFTGTISRNKTIRQVLTMLEKTKDIHFKIEGRRVTVMP